MFWQVQTCMKFRFLFPLVPWFGKKGDCVGQMFLKEQNEKEVQSQLVGYRWSVTQTKTASLGK